jgi:glucosylceramidase
MTLDLHAGADSRAGRTRAALRALSLGVTSAAVALLFGRGCATATDAPSGACACASSPAPSPALADGGGAADGGSAAPSGFMAAQWVASESCPFSLANPSLDWFTCPHPIRHPLDRLPDLPITSPGGTAPTRIDVDPAVAYQTILGTGISIEESSVSNLLKLSPAKRAEVLTAMLDRDRGAGMNLFRVTMGSSDFTGRPWYTYDDVPPGAEDPDLAHFSIQKDFDAGIIGVLKAMLAMSPGITFFASPWSPPAWMKDNGQITGWLFGGSLRSDKIPVLARYFRRFVEAYRDAGVPIYAVTLQNEPRATSPFMPTCLVGPEQEALLVKAVKKEFAAGGLDTRVWVYDQNFDVGVDYARAIFADPAALAATDGVAFHDYAGDPSAMSTLHALYPDKDVFFTEKALWGVAGMDRAAQYFRNWARSYVSWVTMLDQDGLPNDGPNSEKPRRFVRSLTYAGDEYYPTPEHYLFGLYSRFVLPGARRIESTYGSADSVTDVAFLDPDGTIVTVVINQTATVQEVTLRSENNQIWAALDAKTAAAFVWRAGLGKSAVAATPPGR